MAITYRKISSTTIGSGQTTLNLTGIPQTYTDLVLRCSLRSTAAANFQQLEMTFNGDTGGNYIYSGLSMSSVGGVATYSNFSRSGQSSIGEMRMNGANSTANTFADIDVYISNYSTVVRSQIAFYSNAENNSASAPYWIAGGGYWNNTAAITSIRLTQPTDNFVSGSTVYLYGILKAS